MIIFIYIILTLCYFLNGSIFRLNDIRSINLVHLKRGTLSVEGQDQFQYLQSLNSDSVIKAKFFNYYFFNGYLFFLSDAHIFSIKTLRFKEKWLNFNVLFPSSLKSEYSREFHKFMYTSLSNDEFFFGDNYKFFNNIKLYAWNFLNNLYFNGVHLKFKAAKNNLTVYNLLYTFATKKNFSKFFISNINIYVFENLYNIILNMVNENIGGNVKRAVRFFPFIFSLFIFILIANLIGLIPYSSTVTSYLIVTFSMAVMVLVGVNIIAGRFHGLVYFGHFLPSGCPFGLYPLIIPIEFISYVFRVVSLSVRLFANMMAGHTLLAVLAGFGYTMAVGTSTDLFFHHPAPIFVVFVLVFLETAVAIIQSYVFTILTCMYLDEAINLH